MHLLQQFILIYFIKSCLSEIIETPDTCHGSVVVEISLIKHVLDKLKSQHAEILALKSELAKISHSQRLPTNCKEAGGGGSFKSDLYKIQYPQVITNPFTVWCDMETDNGGWLVIQRRVNADVDFHRDWNDYRAGFGNASGNYWIGLENLHTLTARCEHELYIKLEAFDGTKHYAKYNSIEIGSESENYVLKKVGHYTGNGTECLKYHEGSKFSTYDRDNDDYPLDSCADMYGGGWWFKMCLRCNFNGEYPQKDSNNLPVAPEEQIAIDYDFVQLMVRPTKRCRKH